jgi:hypothetical protein
MASRSRALSVEMVMVMLVLVVFALVVFTLIGAGTNAYNRILSDKQNMQSARVAYSYVNMKIKQNDVKGCVKVGQTEFGDTLIILSADGEYVTYLFFSEGALYECLTAQGGSPAVAAANRITTLDGFALTQNGHYIEIICTCRSGDSLLSAEGTVGVRS